MKRLVKMLFVFGLAMIISNPAWGFPGLLQLATRKGFWANDFPDGPLYLQHIYFYQTDEIWDGDGDTSDIQEISITASLNRLIYAWHFGNNDEYQYILEGIFPMWDVSGEANASLGADSFTESGLGDPYLYTAVGWNNPEKTTHVQGALVWRFPLGDDDVMDALGFGNSHSVMPILAIEKRIDSIMIDASIGYMYNFEDLDTDAKDRNYFEVNAIAGYNFSTRLPMWVYVQGDYTILDDGDDDQGQSLNNDGFNITIAPGFGVAIRPNMTLDLKYAMDIDGENTLKGNGLNLRFLWVF